jgi:iron complex outermembrane recepter protein
MGQSDGCRSLHRPKVGRRASRPAFALAISGLVALPATAQQTPATQSSAESTGEGLQEIVVTAEKRESTIQKTPISLSAISGEALQEQGLSNVESVALEVPGISMRSSGPGQTEFEMRGLSSSGGSSPTVGFYLDDIPLTPPAASLNGKVVIDPDLYDLSRIEVLRGPQGTLYGSGSMGGTIRLLTNQPDLTKFSVSGDVNTSNTDGGGWNYGGSGMVNIPLINDQLALRIVGTEKYNSGWIDRIVVSPFPQPVPSTTCAPFLGCDRGDVSAAPVVADYKNVNAETLQGTRVSLLYRPVEQLTIEPTLMYQEISSGGYSEFDWPPGPNRPLAHYQPYNQPEPFEDIFRLAALNIKYQFESAELTSATGYFSREETQTQDISEALDTLFNLNAYYPNNTFSEDDKSRQFSQELRLTSTYDGPFQWIVGGFYSNFKSVFLDTSNESELAALSTGGAAANPDGAFFDANNPYKISQKAVFGEASYNLPFNLKATAGLRWYSYDTSVDIDQWGAGTQFGNATPTLAHVSASANGFNPKANLAYIPNDDLTVYATASKGFRPGGVNFPVPTSGPQSCLSSLQADGLNAAPLSYGPDTVWDYELGEKARLADGRITVNADFYYIRWNAVQQVISLTCGYPYITNAGNARSYGPEIEINAELTRELTLTLSGDNTKANLTSVDPTTGLTPGVPIQNVPDRTGSATLTYKTVLTSDYSLTARINDNYVGSSTDVAYGTYKLPPYSLINARLGVIGSNHFTTYLFGNNLANKVAWLSTNTTSISVNVPSLVRVSTNQPRTIGIGFQYRP